MRHGGQSIRWKGDTNSMANMVMRHLLGYNCNLYADIGDVERPWNLEWFTTKLIVYTYDFMLPYTPLLSIF